MATGDMDVMLVREVLARELETINTYQAQRSRAEDESVKAFLTHIADEEKEHVAEALELIRAMDPVQAMLLESGHVPKSNGAETTPAAVPEPSAAPPSDERGFTVGSLRTTRVR
jgi:rubrerythrin